jgi:hypothetical protein
MVGCINTYKSLDSEAVSNSELESDSEVESESESEAEGLEMTGNDTEAVPWQLLTM